MLDLLVIEDDLSIAELMTEILTEEGYRVSVTQTGDGAVAAIRDSPVAVIITDLDRGRYSDALWHGIDDLRLAYPTTPIIVYTAHSQALEVAPAQHDVSSIILKPFDIADLLAQVAQFSRRDAGERPI